MLRKSIFCLFILSMLGCATTDDPRRGGLFDYNPKAYEKRLEARRQELAKLEYTRQELERETHTFQNEVEAKQELRAQQREQLDILAQDLARLDDEIVKIQQNVDKYQARTAAQKRERKRILVEVRAVKRQLSMLRQSSQIPEAEKQEKIAKLQHDIDALLKITVHLAAQ